MGASHLRPIITFHLLSSEDFDILTKVDINLFELITAN